MEYGVVYYKDTDNLGDDIQTYAALKQLPNVKYYIDREAMNIFRAEDNAKIAVLMNAWFLHKKYNWPPSEYIYPLCISMHFSKLDFWGIGYDYLDGAGESWLRKYQPIGCRDKSTQEMCEGRNIDCYLSGCLTLTLPMQSINRKRKEYICVVDIPDSCVDTIKKEVGDADIEIVKKTHFVNYKKELKSLEERMEIVEQLLTVYQNAKCVVTKRLHCALPCLAMGVPVLFLYDEADDLPRLETFFQYIHTETTEHFNKELSFFSVISPPENMSTYKHLRENLKQVVSHFIKKCDERILPMESSSASQNENQQATCDLLVRIADVSYFKINELTKELADEYSLRIKFETESCAYQRALNERMEELSKLYDTIKELWITIQRQSEEIQGMRITIQQQSEEIQGMQITIQKQSMELNFFRPIRYTIASFLRKIMQRIKIKDNSN